MVGTQSALALFLVTATGGFTLLSFHLRGRALPSALIIGHGLVAVSALMCFFCRRWRWVRENAVT
jgi:hypothetical protein